MAASDHEVEVEVQVQPQEAARVHHDVGMCLGSGRPLPLNSKRLTVVLMKQLVRGLKIPTTSSGDELQTLIKGKLAALHEAREQQAVRDLEIASFTGTEEKEKYKKLWSLNCAVSRI